MNKNVVIYFDEGSFNQEFQRLENARTAFQSLLDEFNSLGLPEIDMAGLINLAQQGEAFVKTLLESQIPEQSFGLFKMSKKKAVEMLELPDLSRLIELAKAAAPDAWIARNLNSNGKKVSIESDAPENLKISNSIKAETADQKKLFQSHQRLAEIFQEFNTLHYRVYGRILMGYEPISNLISIEQESRTESTIIDAVKKLSGYKINKDTGEPLEETLTPAYTQQKTTFLDPVAKLNNFFYVNNRFPIDR